jgi:hypothetical protein
VHPLQFTNPKFVLLIGPLSESKKYDCVSNLRAFGPSRKSGNQENNTAANRLQPGKKRAAGSSSKYHWFSHYQFERRSLYLRQLDSHDKPGPVAQAGLKLRHLR